MKFLCVDFSQIPCGRICSQLLCILTEIFHNRPNKSRPISAGFGTGAGESREATEYGDVPPTHDFPM